MRTTELNTRNKLELQEKKTTKKDTKCPDHHTATTVFDCEYGALF